MAAPTATQLAEADREMRYFKAEIAKADRTAARLRERRRSAVQKHYDRGVGIARMAAELGTTEWALRRDVETRPRGSATAGAT